MQPDRFQNRVINYCEGVRHCMDSHDLESVQHLLYYNEKVTYFTDEITGDKLITHHPQINMLWGEIMISTRNRFANGPYLLRLYRKLVCRLQGVAACYCYRRLLQLLFSTLSIAGTLDVSTTAVVTASNALQTWLNQGLDTPLRIPYLGACVGAVVAELVLNAAEKVVTFL